MLAYLAFFRSTNDPTKLVIIENFSNFSRKSNQTNNEYLKIILEECVKGA